MRMCDWSSDVCSSDLPVSCIYTSLFSDTVAMGSMSSKKTDDVFPTTVLPIPAVWTKTCTQVICTQSGRCSSRIVDRKDVEQGKSWSGRLDLGSTRIIKKKNYMIINHTSPRNTN